MNKPQSVPHILAIILATLLIGVQAVNARVLAVLEISPSSEDTDLTIPEFRHLTDELRAKARATLPRGYSVLTRDNIIQLIPQDEAQAECLAESCAIDIGRAIGAEYVTQGFVGKFQGMLTLTVELYESMSGNMLGSFVTESYDAKGLLGTIREKAPELFAGIVPLENINAASNSQLSPLTSAPKKNNSSFFVALSFDFLGAAAIGFGVYQQIQANKLNDDYRNMAKEPAGTYSDSDVASAFKSANDARKTGNIALIAGSILLATGITIHIWF
ncbi:MAG: DUF3280 domain-containing protein [Fibromonadaceae bacterium]|jgi:hypothetical protein|nr:DUF3280 domain-containing protein [Fibromonadaceae bacterium]